MVIAASVFKPKPAIPVNSFLQRLLLITDGRMTDILQAYSRETVEAVKLRQKLIISNDRPNLQLDRQYQLMERSIVLQGTRSKTNYLYANSQIVLERLDPAVRNELIFTCQPIGKLLKENQIETDNSRGRTKFAPRVLTYREIIDCGIEPAGSLAQYFQIDPASEIIYRTYLVLIKRLPVLQITEKFPITHFVD